jgi:hypothetical protein
MYYEMGERAAVRDLAVIQTASNEAATSENADLW